MQQASHKVPVDILARSLGVSPASLTPLGVPGGQGEVWRLQEGTRAEAVKVFLSEIEPHRIPAEVAALQRVHQENVVGFVGEHILRIGTDEYHCLRYELVTGTGLHEALGTALPDPNDLKRLGRGLFQGLLALHDQHIVHRDLKPMNIVLRDGNWGRPVIIDFGLVRLVDSATNTIYPWAHGTWPFMALEQLLGQRAYERADVFAIGVVLYMSKMGVHPFLAPQEFRSTPPPDYLLRIAKGPPEGGLDPATAAFYRTTICAQAVLRASALQASQAWENLP